MSKYLVSCLFDSRCSQQYAWSRPAVLSLVSVGLLQCQNSEIQIVDGLLNSHNSRNSFSVEKKNFWVCCGSSCSNKQVAAVLTATGHITAATSRITFAHVWYSQYFTVVRKMPSVRFPDSPIGSWPPPGLASLDPVVSTPQTASWLIGLSILSQLTIVTTLHL